ncbi:hypothetical protein [Streptomyces sp. NPDC002088]|uniref:hypothetical protein n=1 Tax=unclassified Streptomyces TaxID=2593676 RepID=UPI00331867BF
MWGSLAALLGVVLMVFGAMTLRAPGDNPELSVGVALALLAPGVYGVCVGVVVLRRAREELPESLTMWGLMTWFAMVAAIPAVAYGSTSGGPVIVGAVWGALLLLGCWFVRRETDD